MGCDLRTGPRLTWRAGDELFEVPQTIREANSYDDPVSVYQERLRRRRGAEGPGDGSVLLKKNVESRIEGQCVSLLFVAHNDVDWPSKRQVVKSAPREPAGELSADGAIRLYEQDDARMPEEYLFIDRYAVLTNGGE